MRLAPAEKGRFSVPSIGNITGSPKISRALGLITLAQAGFSFTQMIRNKWVDRTSFTVSLPGDDPIYDDMHQWLLRQIPPRERRALVARAKIGSDTRGDNSDGVLAEGVVETSARRHASKIVSTYDGDTVQKVMIGGFRIQVSVSEESSPGMNLSGRESMGSYRDMMRSYKRLKFVCPSLHAQTAVLALMAEIAATRARTDRPPTFRIATKWGGWDSREEISTRSIDSVVLRSGQVEGLLADMQHFLDNEAAYVRLGIPWHHGLLLYGPPGTGKTSIAKALASHFGLDVYYLALSDLSEDSSLIQLVSSIGARAILLLEDIDVAASAALDRDEVDSSAQAAPSITMSGLLNALDGMATPHGLITIMTTNRIDALDEAVIRAGRIDRREEIGLITSGAHLRRLVLKLTGIDHDFSAPLTPPVAPAEIVGIIKSHLDNPHDAVDAIIRHLSA